MFLARTDEQRRFEVALGELRDGRGSPGPSQVFVLHGLGGMGKTELCRRFSAIASGELGSSGWNLPKYVVVTVDWQNERENHGALSTAPIRTEPSELLAVLHDAIVSNPAVANTRKLKRRAGSAFGPFRQTLSHLPALRAQEKDSATQLDSDPWGAVLDQGLKTAGGAGTILTGNPLPASVGSGMARAARVARQRKKTDLDPGEIQLALRPAETMTREFANGLRELSRARPVVMILDTYEIATNGGGWIRQIMRLTGDRVLWVVAARLEPEEEAGRSGELASFRQEIPEDRLRTIPMSRFGRQTIAEELAQRGVPAAEDGDTLDLVASITRGVPLAVGIVAGMLAQGQGLEEIGSSVTSQGDTSRLVRELTERYLLHALEDPSLSADIPLLYALALLYTDRTDPDVLQALWGRDHEVSGTLSNLAQRHDFVLTGTRRLHQEVRDTFRRYLLDDARRAQLREANRRASQVALRRAAGYVADLHLIECLESEGWRSAAAVYVWHRFWEGNAEGLDAMCGLFPVSVLLHPEFAHELIGIATFFDETATAEQAEVLRGLTSLLSFGGFLAAWLGKRSAAFAGGDAGDPADGRPEIKNDRSAALRWLGERDVASELLPDSAPQAAIASLFTARATAATDPEGALVALERAAEGISEHDGPLAAVVGELAGWLARRLTEAKATEAVSPNCLLAAELRVRYEGESPAAWFGVAWAHTELGEKEDACDAYQAVADRFLDDQDVNARRLVALALANKTVVCRELGDRPGLRSASEALLARFADDSDRGVRREVAKTMFGLAADLTEADEPQDALPAYERVLARFQDDEEDQEIRRTIARALTNKALTHKRLGDRPAADASYGELVERFEADPDPELRRMTAQGLFTLAVMKREEREWEAALGFLDRQLALGDGEDSSALHDLACRARIERAEVLHAIGHPDAPDIGEVHREIAGIRDPSVALLEVWSMWLHRWGEDPDAAKSTFERALEAGTEGGNCHANFAQLLFEIGEEEEGCRQADLACAAALPSERPAVLEVLFYLVALGPEKRSGEALKEARALLEDGVRSPGWPLDRILTRAASVGRSDLEWLRVLAQVVNDELPLDDLGGWEAWEQAASGGHAEAHGPTG